MSDELRIGIAQMASGADPVANTAQVRGLLSSLREDCDLVILPENVFCLGRGETVSTHARTMADWFADLGALTREFSTAAIFGGVPVADGEEIMNASLVLDADGTFLARYDKMHLFQLDPDHPDGVDETRHYGYGPIPMAFEFMGWQIGLSICYDLRFPELYRFYAPCDLFVCTAAFTAATGEAHWEPLLRARAIENQCYIAAAGQCGTNPETGIRHHGHSMVVDAWGTVVGELSADTEETTVLTLSKDAIRKARARIPALEHRRFRILEPEFGLGEGDALHLERSEGKTRNMGNAGRHGGES